MGVLPLGLGDDAPAAPQIGHNAVIRFGNHQNVPLPEALGHILQVLAHAEPGGYGLFCHALAGKKHMTHHMDLHHVGGAGNAQGHSGCDNHNVAALHHAGLLGRVHRVVKQGVRVALFRDEQGRHAPGKVQLAADVFLCGTAHNGIERPELGELPGCHPGLGDGNNGLRPQIVGRGAGGVGNGVGHVKRYVAVVPRIKPVDVIDAGLRAPGNVNHGLQRFHRVQARGGLAGEHNAAGAIIDGVGHVRGLGPGGPGVLHHGIQHLGGGDHLLAGQVGFFNQLLLQHRHILEGDLHPHVAPGHHNAIGNPQDFINVFHALHILNLSDDVDGVAFILFQYAADFQNILCCTGKGGGDEVEPVFNAENNVRTVPLTDKGHGELGPGHIDALVVGDPPPVDHGTDNIRLGNVLGAHLHQAIVNEHPGLGLQVAGQALVADGDRLAVSRHVPGG